MHWKYTTKPDPKSHFGFVYLITNKKTGKAYVGCKQYWHRIKRKKGSSKQLSEKLIGLLIWDLLNYY